MGRRVTCQKKGHSLQRSPEGGGSDKPGKREWERMVLPDGMVMNSGPSSESSFSSFPSPAQKADTHPHPALGGEPDLARHPPAHSAWFKGDPEDTNRRIQSGTLEHTSTLSFWLVWCRLDTTLKSASAVTMVSFGGELALGKCCHNRSEKKPGSQRHPWTDSEDQP